MTHARRTLQIPLPRLHWRFLYTRKVLGAICALLLAVFGFYWWVEIRPFVRIPGGVLRVSMRDVLAEDEGALTELLVDDFFKSGQILFSTKDPAGLAQLRQIHQSVQEHTKELASLQSKFDQNMQQYVYLQNELETQIGPTELTEQILGEIHKLQDRILHLEQELQRLEASRVALENKTSSQAVLAPFDGMVLQRDKQLGEKVIRGDCLLKICDGERRWIDAEMEENMLALIRPGLPARIEFPSLSGQTWNGQVSWVSPIVDAGKVKIRLTADQLPLRPGLSAKISVKAR